MTPKFKVGDILITTGPDERRCGKIIVPFAIEYEDGEILYMYMNETRAAWTEPNLRLATPLELELL